MEIILLGALLMYSAVSINLYYMAEFASGQGIAQEKDGPIMTARDSPRWFRKKKYTIPHCNNYRIAF